MNGYRSKFSLLLVDDEPNVLSTLKRTFLGADYDIHTAPNGREALELLRDLRIDAAIIDLKMPGMDGLTLLKNLKKDHPRVMAVMLTGHSSIKEAVEAVKLGAVDFLEKPFLPEELRARMAQLHRIWELEEANRNLRTKIESQFSFDRLVGNSTAILRLKQKICQVGPSDESILIQGETGTGKELVARAIHRHSRRSNNNFVPVDCAAISETVIESELFGHVKGAFTGAHISTLGLIRSADKGTLFLDEIFELSLPLQAKLLRTIQEQEIRPVGSDKSFPVNVRIISATNRNLKEEVGQGSFREDLFYRLNVVTLNVPSLRDRKEDIPLLARYFVKRIGTEFIPLNKISQEALICMENYDWPGNVRELENVIRRAMVMGEQDVITPDDLPPTIYVPSDKNVRSIEQPSDDSLAASEKIAIQNVLTKSRHNRKKAAQILGIGEATLYRKIKKYRIKS